MGLHKLIYTAVRSSKQLVGFSEEDRRAARKIIASEKAVREFEYQAQRDRTAFGESVLSQAYLQVGYVGNMPSEPGHYMIADTTSDGTQYVVLTDRMTCCGMPLERFNMRSYQWFLLPKLSSDDFANLKGRS